MVPQKWLKNINNDKKKSVPHKLLTSLLGECRTEMSGWKIWAQSEKKLFSAIWAIKIHDTRLTVDIHKGWLLVYTASMNCDSCVPSNMLSLQTAVWHGEVHVKTTSEKWAHARGHFSRQGRHYLPVPLSWLIRRGWEMWQRWHQMTAVCLYICLSAPELLYHTASVEQRCGTHEQNAKRLSDKSFH